MTNSAELLWDTSPLYSGPGSPQLEHDLAEGERLGLAFRERYLGKVATLNATGLRNALEELESLLELLARPQIYAHLLFAVDTEDDTHKQLSQRTAEFGNRLTRELLFFDLEIMAIPDETFATLLADGQLGTYRHHLEAVRRFRRHTLSEREEQLLKLKGLTGSEAFTRLFDELSASLRYRMELDGEEQEFTGEELLGLLHHPEATVRERAFATYLGKHEEQEVVLGAVFNNVTLDHSQELELRDYASPMEPTNLGNELPVAVVERLMSVSEANYGLARDYFRLKARLLGLPVLKNTDIYAPVAETSRQYTFAEARELVLAAYDQFSPRCREIIATFFTERRIDVMPRSGKAGGAFCMGMTPHLSPYVLLNFTGNLRDVATLAHELGHGLHFELSRCQTLLSYHAPLPLAETASVFGEMLLTRLLLAREADPAVKIALLCAKIEDIIATTFRQNVLTRFEERLHRERRDGLLTTTRICDLWWDENARLYGESVSMIEPYRWGWSYISHFIHARFYCYSYTFAELLVLSLYRKYEEEGELFVPTYLDILASGGSRSPADTVAPAGIDLEDPGFWQRGYDFLAELIEELRSLL